MLIKSEMLPGKAKTGTKAQLLQTGTLFGTCHQAGPTLVPTVHQSLVTQDVQGPEGKQGYRGALKLTAKEIRGHE